MTQVIIYTNDNGNVSVCYPTGELPIEDVLAKDCPEHAVIVDADALPQDEDDFFDAWRLVSGSVSVDLAAAKNIQIGRLNTAAKEAVAQRAMNTAIGIDNDVSDADFAEAVIAKRLEIGACETTAEIRAVKLEF
jgi:hypothetical protein